jgi:hypothetical protein
LTAAGVAVALAAAGAGCGKSDEEKVRDAIEGVASATAKRDYERLCKDLFARRLVDSLEERGLPCTVALQIGFGSVRKPRVEIRRVTVKGDRASAVVHSSAANQPPSDDLVRLVRERGSWRVSSLSEPPREPKPTAKPATTTRPSGD